MSGIHWGDGFRWGVSKKVGEIKLWYYSAAIRNQEMPDLDYCNFLPVNGLCAYLLWDESKFPSVKKDPMVGDKSPIFLFF